VPYNRDRTRYAESLLEYERHHPPTMGDGHE
jgi:hypothetical protein